MDTNNINLLQDKITQFIQEYNSLNSENKRIIHFLKDISKRLNKIDNIIQNKINSEGENNNTILQFPTWMVVPENTNDDSIVDIMVNNNKKLINEKKLSNKYLNKIAREIALLKLIKNFDFKKTSSNRDDFCNDLINLYWAYFREINPTKYFNGKNRLDINHIGPGMYNKDWNVLSEKCKSKIVKRIENNDKLPNGKIRRVYVPNSAQTNTISKKKDSLFLDWFNLNKNNISYSKYMVKDGIDYENNNDIHLNSSPNYLEWEDFDKTKRDKVHKIIYCNQYDVNKILNRLKNTDIKIGIYCKMIDNASSSLKRCVFQGSDELITTNKSSIKELSGSIRCFASKENNDKISSNYISLWEDKIVNVSLIPRKYRKHTHKINTKLNEYNLVLKKWYTLRYYEILEYYQKIEIICKNNYGYITKIIVQNNIKSAYIMPIVKEIISLNFKNKSKTLQKGSFSHPNSSLADKFIKLNELYQNGFISKQELENCKKSLV